VLFITTQPDTDYYIWQTEVQLNNFKKFACDNKTIVVFGYNALLGINPKILELKKRTRANVLCYPDTRNLSTRLYSPSIKPHLIKKFFENDGDLLKNQHYIHLDSDIIFTSYPNFNDLYNEKVIHVSDTSSQFSFDTIKEKNPVLFNEMCKIVGINPYVIEKNKINGGGIVFFYKKFHYFNYDFWDKVENDSHALYKLMLVSSDKFRPIELVTATKWAILWNLWLMGYETKISNELAVCWATNPIKDWKEKNLYNNAGVNENDKKYLFYKSDYVEKCPFESDLSYVSDEYCSYNYVKEIIETAKALK
jgi:hypothetical protein